MSERQQENLRKRLRAGTALNSALSLLASRTTAYALPTGGQVQDGQANIATNGGTLNVSQTTGSAIVDWQSFDVVTVHGSRVTTEQIVTTVEVINPSD